MRTFNLCVGLLALAGSAYAQRASNNAPEKFGNMITAADLKKHLYIVAGPTMQGRETATEGQRIAAKYISDHFKKIGLKPGANGQWEQFYSLYMDTLTNGSIKIGDKAFAFGDDYYGAIRELKNQTTQASTIVFAGYGKEGDFKNVSENSQVVLLLQEPPKQQANQPRRQFVGRPTEQLRAAASKGANTVFIVMPAGFDLSRIKQRVMRSGIYMDQVQTMEYLPNYYYISKEMAESIMGADKYNAAVAATLAGNTTVETFNKSVDVNLAKGTNESKSSNVLGLLEGTDKKDEVLFVTAHYDHLGIENGEIHYGADDDGSGTVSVLELAEAFAAAKKAGKGPRRSIVFMTVSGEEKGLLGSKYYTDHPIYPLANTVADLNIDMIGRIDDDHKADTNYVYIIGDDKLSSEMRPISEAANKMTNLKLDYKYNDPNDPNRFYYRSDHYMFAQHNIPIIFYFNGVHADYHKPTDTVEKITYNLMEKRAKLVFYTAWEIANRNEKLKVDRHEK
ncbi:peptidase M28-like protein [Chitinophaga skermanii]|uniref:Peptidase M28-like protein n=1 Tax=Chitinophaga skermanii TaxID=331697 RepID=A0A327R3U4_9BACT|nr:M28 family peptidase [Chitinophaga skermanii]RAJ10444.1 peptidase M28-like protein [Chitinophaga skermanii]